jgi:ubiquinone/menaquinone biosynthesis C-methylase UbiE
MPSDIKATVATQRRYNRNAPLYDLMEGLVEISRYSKWRSLLWSKVEGTGKNFPYYPKNADITAIDLSDKMLARAIDKASEQNIRVHLQQMDVENLEFEDNIFDTIVATFVFCSVPNPLRGLAELERVCKSGGKVVLLDHVLSANRILGGLMNIANPLVVRMMGANINRRTVENVSSSGLVVEKVTDLEAGIFKLIEARKNRQTA